MSHQKFAQNMEKNFFKGEIRKRKSSPCVKVLSKDFFMECMAAFNDGIIKLTSEIIDLKEKLEFLEENCMKVQKEGIKITKTDLKTTLDFVDSTDSSVQILKIITPPKLGSQSRKKFVKRSTYNPFAAVDQSDEEWLDAWMKINRCLTVNLGIIKADKQFFRELIEPQTWLNEDHINVGMSLMRRKLAKVSAKVSCPFRSERLAFFDVPFTMLISKSYQEFSENPRDFDWNAEFADYYSLCFKL